MALQPRIASPARISRIPMPQSGPSPLADALGVAAQTATAMDQVERQADQQVSAIDHQLALKEQEEADNAMIVAQSAEFAKAQSRIDLKLGELRQSAKAWGIGHTAAAKQIIDEEVKTFDAAFGQNERVRQRFTANVVKVAASYETRETLYEKDLFAKAQGDAAETFLSETENALYLDPDPKKIEERMALWRTSTDALAMDENVRNAVRKKGETRIFGSFLEGLYAKGDYDAADALIKSGKLNGVVDDVEPFLRRGEAGRRAAQVAAEQAASDARESARASIRALEEKIKIGVNPSPKEIAAVRASAVAAGLPEADIIGLDGLGIQMGLNRDYGEAQDPTGAKAAAAVARIGAKIAAGTASEAEQVAYAHLKGVADERGKAFGASLKNAAGQGAQGRLAVLAQLSTLPKAQRFIAAEEVGEGLGFLSLLDDTPRKYAVEGREARLARKDEFGTDKEVKAAFKKRLGGVAATLGGDYDDVMGVSWDIYAGMLQSRGQTGWQPEYFDTAVKIALGATRREDGRLQGGVGRVRGHDVILPGWKTADEFDVSLSRLTFKGAVYANGKPASKADILSNYRPEYYREDSYGQPIYRFIDAAGKPLRHKDGAIFDVAVKRPK